MVNLNSLERDRLRQAELCPRHTIMKKKRVKQKKRWEDNIKEWTGMDFASSTRAVKNRTKWKGIYANSSVVPRRSFKVMGLNRKIEIAVCVFHELLYTSFPFALKYGMWGLSLRKSSSISLSCMSFLN